MDLDQVAHLQSRELGEGGRAEYHRGAKQMPEEASRPFLSKFGGSQNKIQPPYPPTATINKNEIILK